LEIAVWGHLGGLTAGIIMAVLEARRRKIQAF
jgi:membrane associated rhomboid family serine protease